MIILLLLTVVILDIQLGNVMFRFFVIDMVACGDLMVLPSVLPLIRVRLLRIVTQVLLVDVDLLSPVNSSCMAINRGTDFTGLGTSNA